MAGSHVRLITDIFCRFRHDPPPAVVDPRSVITSVAVSTCYRLLVGRIPAIPEGTGHETQSHVVSRRNSAPHCQCRHWMHSPWRRLGTAIRIWWPNRLPCTGSGDIRTTGWVRRQSLWLAGSCSRHWNVCSAWHRSLPATAWIRFILNMARSVHDCPDRIH
jgi:hypothetical protein